MASYTPNYNLKKPAQDDFFDVDDFNENSDKIDTALNNKADKNLSNITGTLPISKGGTGATTASNALSNLGIDTALNNKADKDLSNITGTLPISKGGTGATTASNALSNLGIDTALNNKADKDLSNITGTLPVSKGGTGATTASNALSNLGAFSSSGGTIAGDVKLKTTSSNYGCALTFGDGTSVRIKEPTDNTMEINANKINLAITSGIQYLTVSSSVTSGTTTNQKTVFNSDGTIADACRKIYVQSSTPSSAPDGSLWAW